MGDDRDRIGRSDESTCAVDHVAIPVSIAGSAEFDPVALNGLDQRMGVGEVRIWMAAAKIWKRDAVLAGGRRETEGGDEDRVSVWSCDAVEAVEKHAEGISMRG